MKNKIRDLIKEQRSFKLIEVLIILVATSIICLAVGGFVGYKTSITVETKYQNIDDSNLEEFIEVYDTLLDDYYMDLEKPELIQGAIDGMLDSLEDPYTTYMDELETTNFSERMTGDYEGIGAIISVDEEGRVIIGQPFDGSPAKNAGLLPQDIIMEVNGENTEGFTAEMVATLIKGDEGTEVSILIDRDGEEKEFKIIRESITIEYVFGDIYESNNKEIGYIKIESFSSNSYTQFLEELNKIEKNNVDGLIIDVRNNSGGYLDRVSKIVSLFLDNDEIIYQLQTQDDISKVYSYSSEYRNYEVVVLINEYSASASEILAGAFKDSYGSEIIGIASYGKGTVQRTLELDAGGMIKFTVEKWLTPNGDWIHSVGIKPTIEVQLSEDYYDNPTVANDNQLQKAIETIAE